MSASLIDVPLVDYELSADSPATWEISGDGDLGVAANGGFALLRDNGSGTASGRLTGQFASASASAPSRAEVCFCLSGLMPTSVQLLSPDGLTVLATNTRSRLHGGADYLWRLNDFWAPFVFDPAPAAGFLLGGCRVAVTWGPGLGPGDLCAQVDAIFLTLLGGSAPPLRRRQRSDGA